MGSLWLDEDWQNDLGEWEVNKDPTSKVHNTTLDSAKAVVADGLLYLYPSSEQPIQAGVGVARTVPAIENGWTIRTSAALSSEIADAAACLVVDAYTGDDSIRLLRFVFDHRFREWRLYVGVNVPNPSGKDGCRLAAERVAVKPCEGRHTELPGLRSKPAEPRA